VSGSTTRRTRSSNLRSASRMRIRLPLPVEIGVLNYSKQHYRGVSDCELGEHKREVFCLSWNLVDKSGFVGTSWDGNVKLVWFLLPSAYEEIANVLKVGTNYLPLTPHDPNHGCTYSALFSLHSATLISTASSHSVALLFDIRTPPFSAKCRYPYLSMGPANCSSRTGTNNTQTSLPLPEWTR